MGHPTIETGGVHRYNSDHERRLPVVDLRQAPAAEREARAEELIFAETQIPFDVTRLPLVRWKLLRLEDELYELVQVEHHFVHDGWSIGNLLRELEVISEMIHRLDDLVGFLGNRPFFHADEPSAADLSVCGMLTVVRDGPMEAAAEALRDRPALLEYMERVEKQIKSPV